MKITDLDDHVQHFRERVLQEALATATYEFWLRRAKEFDAVGNARCDEVAQACRNRAALALGSDEETPSRILCGACDTYTSPYSCSCGQTRVGAVA